MQKLSQQVKIKSTENINRRELRNEVKMFHLKEKKQSQNTLFSTPVIQKNKHHAFKTKSFITDMQNSL